MAKKINYNHPNGTNYSESYWKITALLVDVPKKYAKFVFTGYKDETARLENKEKIGIQIVELRDGTFDIYFQEIILKTKNPQEIGYEYCVNYPFFVDSIDC